MSAAVRAGSLRVISAKPDGAVRRVHLLMRQREALRPLFRTAWDDLAARFEADELEGWAAGVLELADVNAGPSCLVAFWERSRNQPTEEGIASLIVAAHTAANICRNAGAQAAAATLVAVAIARRFLGTGAEPGALVAHHGRAGAAGAGIGRSGGVAHGRNPGRRRHQLPSRVLSRPG